MLMEILNKMSPYGWLLKLEEDYGFLSILTLAFQKFEKCHTLGSDVNFMTFFFNIIT